MAKRGDVFRLARPVGFVEGAPDRVVVLQANRLNGILPTLLVAPLDEAAAVYAKNPLMILATPRETGLELESVVVLTAVSAVPRSRLEATRVGALEPATLQVVTNALAILLGLVEIVAVDP